jgi:hypothetical protein
MFIAKVFTGFGAAIGMRVYLMILPLIMGGNIVFGQNTTPTMNYVIRLLFILGGAWAVYKSSSMLTTLLNFQAGQAESAAGDMVAGGAMSFARGAGGIMGAAGRRLRGGSGEDGGKGGGEDKDGKTGPRQEFKEFKQPLRGGGIPGLSGGAGAAREPAPAGVRRPPAPIQPPRRNSDGGDNND